MRISSPRWLRSYVNSLRKYYTETKYESLRSVLYEIEYDFEGYCRLMERERDRVLKKLEELLKSVNKLERDSNRVAEFIGSRLSFLKKLSSYLLSKQD